MILDLETIKKLSEEKRSENLLFIAFLKKQNSAKIDKLMHELNNHYIFHIDCTQCGNCCMHLRPILAERDIDILIKKLRTTRVKFKKTYVITDEEGDMLFKHLPCKFLLDKKCKLYESRPEDCRSYPHLHKSFLTHRLYGIFENYAICPIVFNVLEDLKTKLQFY